MQLSESKGSVNDVKFSPRHVGLKIAAGSADGIIRIYEATDVFALNYWSLQSSIIPEVGLSSEDGGHGVFCLSWNGVALPPPIPHPFFISSCNY